MAKITMILMISFSLAAAFAALQTASAETTPLTHAVNVELAPEDAMAIAMDSVDSEKAGPITSIEVEYEDGILVYTVEFTKDDIKTEVKVDAQTGTIVKAQSDLDEIIKAEEDQ